MKTNCYNRILESTPCKWHCALKYMWHDFTEYSQHTVGSEIRKKYNFPTLQNETNHLFVVVDIACSLDIYPWNLFLSFRSVSCT